MNIYISIDGVLRNFINRFHYHYEQAYIDVEENEDDFEYKVIEPLTNINISDHFIFQSSDRLAKCRQQRLQILIQLKFRIRCRL